MSGRASVACVCSQSRTHGCVQTDSFLSCCLAYIYRHFCYQRHKTVFPPLFTDGWIYNCTCRFQSLTLVGSLLLLIWTRAAHSGRTASSILGFMWKNPLLSASQARSFTMTSFLNLSQIWRNLCQLLRLTGQLTHMILYWLSEQMPWPGCDGGVGRVVVLSCCCFWCVLSQLGVG